MANKNFQTFRVALFVECNLYGIYLVTFGHCMRVLLSSPSDRYVSEAKKRVKRWLLVVVLLMAVVSTVYNALELRLAFNLFVFGNSNVELDNIRVTMIFVQGVLGDAVLIYRCWVIFQHNRIAVIPSAILYLCLIGVGSVMLYANWFLVLASRTVSLQHTLSMVSLSLWATVALAILSVLTNITTSGLIVHKLWRASRTIPSDSAFAPESSSSRSYMHLRRVIRIMIDAAVLSALWSVLFIVVYVADRGRADPVIDAAIPLTGINFNIIIVRAASEMSAKEGSDQHRTLSTFQAPPQLQPMSRASTVRHRSSHDRVSIEEGDTTDIVELGAGAFWERRGSKESAARDWSKSVGN